MILHNSSAPTLIVFTCDITNNHGAVQKASDGRRYRVIPVIAGRNADGEPRYKSGGIRRCDEQGHIIRRVRMSKKTRLLARRSDAARWNKPPFLALGA